MQPLAPGAPHCLGTLLASCWWLAAAATAQVPAAAPPTASYADLRPQLLEALSSCITPTDLTGCDNASQRLEQLITTAEKPMQRERHPRCLSSLTQLQTHLSVFRWGYQPRERLQAQIDQALADCPATAKP